MAEYECGLRVFEVFGVYIGKIPLAFFEAFFEFVAVAHYTGLDHFAEQVVAFASTFAHAGEYREPVMSFGDVVYKLHN